MIFTHDARKNHPDDVGGQHRLASRPDRHAPQSEKQEQEIFGLQLGDTPAIALEKPTRDERQDQKRNKADAKKDQSLTW